MKRLFLLTCAIWMTCLGAFSAQAAVTVTGQVVDDQNEPIIGASITVPGSNAAAVTDYDGNFKFSVPDNAKGIKIAYIGFKSVERPVAKDLGVIKMEPDNTLLNDVIVTQAIGKTRVTPVAMSNVDQATIDIKLGGQEFPEILKTTPGVYTNKQGGGYGDAETRMRGFKSQWVAVTVNGVPVNDMENGNVYWSNWAGLSDVTSSMQTQRGLGASILSTPSIGGTIAITTRTLDVDKGGSVWYGFGNDGMNQYGLKLSTGVMKNGWAVTVLGAHRWGDGYIQGTAFNGWNWFFNVSKRINDKHEISLTGMGAPQSHNQRNKTYGGLTVEGWQDVRNYMNGESPYRYNPTYGFDNEGRERTSNRNVFHKPQFTLRHMWQIDETSSWATSIYASISSGYGYSGQGRTSILRGYWNGASAGQLNMQFRRPDGTYDYGAIQDMNAASTTGSEMVMSKSNNSHQWYGLVSNYKKYWDQSNGNRLAMTAGVDYRYYVGDHNNKIVDLYDGAYYMDDTDRANVKAADNAAAADPNWKYQHLGVGDIVYRDFKGYTMQEGIYGQVEYTMLDKKLNLVLSGAVSNTLYWRDDHFYYDDAHSKSAKVSFWGGQIKGGANYNIDRHNNVFFNAGYISRAPFFSNAFASYNLSNIVNENAVNEKTYSFEVGYGFSNRVFALTLNAYYTKWLDRAIMRSGYLQASNDRYVLNLQGINARHMGVELDFAVKPTNWFELTGMLSMGNWEWTSNATGYYYSSIGEPLALVKGQLTGAVASGIYAPDHVWSTLNYKGVKVDGSPQTTGALGVTFRPFNGFRIGADWVFETRNYTDQYLNTNDLKYNDVLQVAQPWKMPWGHTTDLHASYKFNMGGFDAVLSGSVNNLFDYNYITHGQSPLTTDGTWENAQFVFYSFGRTYSMKLRLNF
ncbi:MAG: carboxypeptidase-like regulatory domain-containing protein [Muribaculaceae bacterium]|nr:carboxypeptidase-like regulatory domain-containing protein [Muribaculaceae bacterium]